MKYERNTFYANAEKSKPFPSPPLNSTFDVGPPVATKAFRQEELVDLGYVGLYMVPVKSQVESKE